MSHAFEDAGSALPDTQKVINDTVSTPVTESYTIEGLEAQQASYQTEIDAIQAKIDAAKTALSIA